MITTSTYGCKALLRGEGIAIPLAAILRVVSVQTGKRSTFIISYQRDASSRIEEVNCLALPTTLLPRCEAPRSWFAYYRADLWRMRGIVAWLVLAPVNLSTLLAVALIAASNKFMVWILGQALHGGVTLSDRCGSDCTLGWVNLASSVAPLVLVTVSFLVVPVLLYWVLIPKIRVVRLLRAAQSVLGVCAISALIAPFYIVNKSSPSITISAIALRDKSIPSLEQTGKSIREKHERRLRTLAKEE